MDHTRKNSNKTDAQILMQPNIEVDSDTRHSVVSILSKTLANESGLPPKNHRTYWNINGAGFLDQDTLFETQSKQKKKISNELERGMQVGSRFPVGRSEEIHKNSELDEKAWDLPDIIDLEAAIRLLREDALKYSKE